MMVLLCALTLTASAQEASTTADELAGLTREEPLNIYGGAPVEPGDWPDTAAILDKRGEVFCTGTLIAPNVVLSAAHCATGGSADPRSVVLASEDLSGGEAISVTRYEVHEKWQQTYDVAVLILAEDAETAPRMLATDCVLEEHLGDDAAVTIVGYGATEETDFNELKNVVETVVTDHDCSQTGRFDCLEDVSPNGELMAGGDGADSCYGDSGGPLYLNTPEGDFLVGVTSRGASYTSDCGDGGVYVRPDAVLDWIEETAAVTLARPDCGGTGDTGYYDSLPCGGAEQCEEDAEGYYDALPSKLGCSITGAGAIGGLLPTLLLLGLRRR